MKKATTYSFFASLRMAILALIALGGLSMCGKNDVVPDEEDPWTELTGDRPITFTSATSGPVTKTITPLPGDTSFGVFASFHQGDLETFTPNFMYNQAVNFTDTDDDEEADTWTYNPVKYWPNNLEDKLSFWAYSPYTGTESFLKKHGTGTNYSSDRRGIPDINFTLTNGKTDLMVTHLDESNDSYIVKNLQKQAVSGTVDLLFHHVLCKINFVFKLTNDNFNVKLTQIRFDNVFLTDTYDNIGNVLEERDPGWRNIGSVNSFPAFSDLLPQDLSTSDKEIKGVMLIPQTLADTGVNLHIQYTVNDVEDVGDILLSTKHDSWDENTQYTYTVTITPGVHPYIMFSADIKPWEEERGYYPLTL